MCESVLNLSRLVSRGGGEQATVWWDMAGQNGSLMSVDVLQLLSTFYVPHLEGDRDDSIFDFLLFVLSVTVCVFVCVCVCVCVCVWASPWQYRRRTRIGILCRPLSCWAERSTWPALCDPGVLCPRQTATSTPTGGSRDAMLVDGTWANLKKSKYRSGVLHHFIRE